MGMRYFRPRSLTWWAGVSSVLIGATSIALPLSDVSNELSRLVAILSGTGDSSPAGLICLGLGLIGIRDKLERVFNAS